MKNQLFGLFSLVILLGSSSLLVTQGEFTCPIDDDLWMCSCHTEGYSLLICDNYHPAILNDVTALREANNVSLNDWFEMDTLYITAFKELTTLNLTPFAKMNLTTIEFNLNPQVNTVIGGTNSSDEIDIAPYRYVAKAFEIPASGLVDSNVADILKYMEPDSLERFWVTKSKLENVPDFTPFSNLVDVDLSSNEIRRIAGGQFRTANRLQNLNIHRNKISEIGENGFLFDPIEPRANGGGRDLFTKFGIGLTNNNLTDEGIHVNHGLDSAGRETWVGFGSNWFEFLSQEKFEKILLAHPLNMLFFDSNPFICDQRMKWLHDKRAEYETRVYSVNCMNDPGKNVFTTDLIQ